MRHASTSNRRCRSPLRECAPPGYHQSAPPASSLHLRRPPSDYKEAKCYYLQADELIRQKNTPVKYAGELYYNLGILYENYLGDNYHAVESYEKAVSYGQDKNAEKRLIRLYEKLPQRIQ